MARKNLYKINDVLSVDEADFAKDSERFDDRKEFLEEYELARPDIEDYPDDVDEDDLDFDFKEARREERRRNKKTRSEKFHYRGKYELLPERELNKQTRFYFRLFRYRFASLLSGILALGLAFIAWKYNILFSVLTLIAVVPGLLWGLLGLLKIRTKGIIIVIIGLLLNVLAVIMVIRPFYNLIPQLADMFQLFKDYLNSIKM